MTIITVDRRELANVLKHGASIVEHSGINVTNNVRVAVAKGRLALTFTDMQIWLSTSIDAAHDTITETTLPANLLSRAANAMEGLDIKIDVKGTWAHLSSGAARLKLPTLPAEQFPNPEIEDVSEVEASVDGEQLAKAIDAAAYAAPDGFANFAAAILFDGDHDGELRVQTRDSTRLARAKLQNDGAPTAPFCISPKAARTVGRLAVLPGCDSVKIALGGSRAYFDLGNWSLRAGIIDAVYPNVDKVIDERCGDPIMFDPRAMERALGRLALVTDQYSKGVKVELEPDKATISLVNNKSGEAVEEVPVAYEGSPQTLGFSLPYMRDALRFVEGDDAEMWIGSDIKRAVIFGRDGGSSVHMIAPFSV